MGKICLLGAARAYVDTLRNYRTGKIMLSDVIVQIILPVILAVIFAFIWPLENKELDSVSANIISGVSIISALLCGVAVMIFQLRMQMSSQCNPKPTKKETKLVDETFHDILWAVIVGFASVLLTIFANAVSELCVLQRVLGGLTVGFLGNFVMVTCMCIKRLSSTYLIVSKGWSND